MAGSVGRNQTRIACGSLDRLSSLPKEVIDEILVRTPIIDAVKTSMLSRGWRNRWMSMSKLIFNKHSILSSVEGGRTSADLANFVTNILFLHNGMVSKFEVNNFLESGCSAVDRWILVLSRKMLKDLVLAFHESNKYQVPPCLFACENLNTLMLEGCKLSSPSSHFKGFSHLTHLDLHSVDVTGVTIDHLVKKCPLLSSLKISSCSNLDQGLNIHAPNLLHCTINGLCGGVKYHNVPKLKYAFINIMNSSHYTTCRLDEVLANVGRVRTLYIFYPKIDDSFWIRRLGPKNLGRIYHDLKVVNMVINFNYTNQIHAVLCLCRSAPNLEELIIKACDEIENDYVVFKGPFWEQQVCKEKKMIFHHLKKVCLSEFKGGRNQLDIAEFILLNAAVLETLNINWKKGIKVDKKLLQVLGWMMQFKRASTEAEVVFSGLS